MKKSLRSGLSFGLTSGIITTLGLMIGLYSGTKSKLVLMGGLFTIAVADSFSDALGIHMSEEAEAENTHREVWESTLAALFSKFFFTFTFIVPLLLLPLGTAVIVNLIWGMVLLIILNIYIARLQNIKPISAVTEHVTIAVVVIGTTHLIGKWVAATFT